MIGIDALWDYGDPIASEARFRAAMETSEGNERDEVATQMARALGLQGKFDEGQAVLGTLTSPSSSRVQVRMELERGRLLNSSGDPGGAVPHFQAAMEVARTTGDIGLEIDAIHMLAIADADNAEMWAGEGIRCAEGSDDPQATRWLGPLLNNLGWSRFDSGRLEAALEAFRLSRAAYESVGKAGAVAIARWSVARCLRESGDLEGALEIQLDLAATNSEPDPYVFEELVALYGALGDVDGANQWQVELDRMKPGAG